MSITTEDIGNIRFKIYHFILDELKMFEDIETLAREKIISQKKRTFPTVRVNGRSCSGNTPAKN